MKLILLPIGLFAIALAQGPKGPKEAAGQPGGGGEERGKRGHGPPESAEDVFVGFPEMDRGCAQKLRDAFECKMVHYEANWEIGRDILMAKKRCMIDAGFEVNEDAVDELSDYMIRTAWGTSEEDDDDDEEPDEERKPIKACVRMVWDQVLRPNIGRCFSGGEWEFPVFPKIPRGPGMLVEVMRGNGTGGGNNRRKRSPGKMFMKMGKRGKGGKGGKGGKMGQMLHMMMRMMGEGEEEEEHGGYEEHEGKYSLFERLFKCDMEDMEEAKYKKRQADECFDTWVEDNSPGERRAENMMSAVQCIADQRINRQCKQELIFRAKNLCKCAKAMQDDLQVNIAVGSCLPKRYYPAKYEIVKKLAFGCKKMLCKKHDKDREFDLDKFFEEQMEAKEELMEAIFEGEVSMPELMRKSMKFMHKAMKKFGEEMMEGGEDGPPMKKMMHKKMAMMQKFMYAMKGGMKGGKEGHYGGGGRGGGHHEGECPAPPPPPPPPPRYGEEECEERGGGRRHRRGPPRRRHHYGG